MKMNPGQANAPELRLGLDSKSLRGQIFATIGMLRWAQHDKPVADCD